MKNILIIGTAALAYFITMFMLNAVTVWMNWVTPIDAVQLVVYSTMGFIAGAYAFLE